MTPLLSSKSNYSKFLILLVHQEKQVKLKTVRWVGAATAGKMFIE